MSKLNECDIGRLRKFITYDERTGDIFAAVARANGKVKAGSRIGNISTKGYVRICFEGKTYAAHRVAWAIFYGEWPKCQVDHKDRNPANNAIKNLRLCPNDNFDNSQNSGLQSNNTSGCAGVNKTKDGYWRARIGVNGKRVSLGVFSEKQAAIKARNDAENSMHPFLVRP